VPLASAADLAFLKAACRVDRLVSWEVVVVLWPILARLEREADR
jgi:hypothetical protein